MSAGGASEFSPPRQRWVQDEFERSSVGAALGFLCIAEKCRASSALIIRRIDPPLARWAKFFRASGASNELPADLLRLGMGLVVHTRDVS